MLCDDDGGATAGLLDRPCPAPYTGISAGVGRVIAAADVTAGEESPDSMGSVLANRQRG